MLQHDEPGDYIVATGETHSVEELVACAFDAVGLDWRDHVRSDPSLYRGTAELHDLVGDASKARRVLGWEPEVRFEGLVRCSSRPTSRGFRRRAPPRRRGRGRGRSRPR